MSHHLHLIWNLCLFLIGPYSSLFQEEVSRENAVYVWVVGLPWKEGIQGKFIEGSWTIWGRIPRGHAEPFARTRP